MRNVSGVTAERYGTSPNPTSYPVKLPVVPSPEEKVEGSSVRSKDAVEWIF
jgi:hypothetical protein